MKLKFGFTTLILAHITFNTPYVILNVLPKLRQQDNSLYEAALDLGCPPFLAFWDADMIHMAMSMGIENILELNNKYLNLNFNFNENVANIRSNISNDNFSFRIFIDLDYLFGFFIILNKKSMFVSTPSITVSSKARFILLIASFLVSPCVIIFAIIES